jgi:hypothetical protein
VSGCGSWVAACEAIRSRESERFEWLPLVEVKRAIRAGEVRDGLSLTALSMALLFEFPAA